MVEQRQTQPLAVKFFDLGSFRRLPPLLCITKMFACQLDDHSWREPVILGLLSPFGEVAAKLGLVLEDTYRVVEVSFKASVTIRLASRR